MGRKATEAELTALRAQVSQLEEERGELVQELTRVKREAQDRTYWLDRWHLDLNRVMRSPIASGLFEFARTCKRAIKSILRRS